MKYKKTKKLGNEVVQHDRKYYLPETLKNINEEDNKPYQIDYLFYDSKWKQDTEYITDEYICCSFNAG